MKRSGLKLLKTLGLVAAARTLQRARAVILTYHGILPGDDDRYDFLNHNFISEAMFDQQLRFVKEHYRPVRLGELVDCYRRGTQPPARSIAITFDDGFENNESVALPLLRKHSLPFTVFLTTGHVGDVHAQLWTERVKRAIYLFPASSVTLHMLDREIRCDLASAATRAAAARRVLKLLKGQPVPNRDRAVSAIESVCGRPPLAPEERTRYAFLEWSQVRAMAASGVEFGSHTVNHPILSTLDAQTLDAELIVSKRRIESELGRPCCAFAYPNGSPADFGDREKRALQRAGYGAAFSLNGRLNGGRPDLYELDRINVGRHLDITTFEAAAAGIQGAARRLRQHVVGVRERAPALGGGRT